MRKSTSGDGIERVATSVDVHVDEQHRHHDDRAR
jgi:hypothetical protein